MALFVHDSNPIPDEELIALDSEDADALMLRGIPFGYISRVSTVLTSETLNNPEQLLSFLKEVESMTDGHTGRHGQVGRTLIANTNAESEKCSEEDCYGFVRLLKSLMLKTKETEQSQYPCSTPHELYLLALQQATQNRRFAVLDSGHFALVPKISRILDQIVAFYTDLGGVPYVIRPHGDGSTLIGAFYVHTTISGQEDSKKRTSRKESSRMFRLI
ncbi:hypothetical protein F5Y16DRAFT_378525 [Xylariaceae sp. FL0255]|nr:hypothetical protein F5Y16DRAFT_378525 [Xylariaceae sp. FL0255]